MYGLHKVIFDIYDNWLHFRPILSEINNPAYILAEFQELNLSSLTSNDYNVNNSFAFVEKIIEHDSDSFMDRLEETINICYNTIFEKIEKVEDLSKIEFKDFSYLATKQSYSILNEKLY